MKGVSGFISERLTEARESREINKTNLARLLGVSNSQISKYESGNQSPSEDVLHRISSVLAFPIDYFFYERQDIGLFKSPIYYRSMSHTTKKQRDSAESKLKWVRDIYQYLSEFIEFPLLNLPDVNPPNSLDKIDGKYIEQIADETRCYWKLGFSPVNNLTRLLENNGLTISFFDLGERLDGLSKKFNDRPVIIISTAKSASVRLRFSLCHELGHLILHKNISTDKLTNSSDFKLLERQAHRFAAAFIFPQSSFRENVLSPDLTTFRFLKPKWKLSIAAMIFRARDLRIINEDTERKLRRSYGARKWKRCEPFDESLTVDYPELFRDSFKLLLEENICLKSDIREGIPLSPTDIEELAGLERNFLKDNLIKIRPQVRLLRLEKN